MRGGQQFRGWDEDRYQSAAMINALRALMHVYIISHIPKTAAKPKPPESWPLPQGTKKQQAVHKPGSFAHIALSRINAVKKLKEGRG